MEDLVWVREEIQITRKPGCVVEGLLWDVKDQLEEKGSQERYDSSWRRKEKRTDDIWLPSATPVEESQLVSEGSDKG